MPNASASASQTQLDALLRDIDEELENMREIPPWGIVLVVVMLCTSCSLLLHALMTELACPCRWMVQRVKTWRVIARPGQEIASEELEEYVDPPPLRDP